MTFPPPIKKRPPKEVKLHHLEFRLKGYAIQDQTNGLREGYFRSQKPFLRIFDPEFNRKRELLINYLKGGYNYSTLWGFKYFPEQRIMCYPITSLHIITTRGGYYVQTEF